MLPAFRRPPSRLSLVCLALLAGLYAADARCGAAEDLVFRSTFVETIDPRFPLVNGTAVLPGGPVSDKLQWVIDELAVGESTTLAEIQARFSNGFNQPGLVDFFNDVLRVNYPDARIVDVVGLSPVRATVVIEGDNPTSSFGFVNIWARYTGSELVTFFQVGPFGGSVQFPADQERTLAEAVDHYQGLAAGNSIFVGRVDLGGQCQGIAERGADTPRALGSIFKMWILAALADRIDEGASSAQDLITLVAPERAAAGIINDEPLGTQFPLREMAVMMMANSDNTSTDHLHELVGRGAIADRLMSLGLAQPELLLPFLNISEQFHVFTRFDLPTAQSYVDGTLSHREQFLANQILPLGSSYPISFPFFHDSLLTTGTWRASARDVCRTLAGLHALPRDGAGFDVVDEALGSQAAQPGIRNHWGRVWYKGGSLTSGATGNHVFTHAWLLQERGDTRPWVVVALSNDASGGIEAAPIQSVTSRIIELIGAMP